MKDIAVLVLGIGLPIAAGVAVSGEAYGLAVTLGLFGLMLFLREAIGSVADAVDDLRKDIRTREAGQ